MKLLDTKIINLFPSLLGLMLCISTSAEAGEFSFNGNKFTYGGYSIDTAFNVTADNFETESGTMATAVSNTFNKQKILQILSADGKMELWLFDDKTEKKLFKIDTLETELSVTWSSPEYIEVSRSQMGQSVSYVYKINPIKVPFSKSASIENMLLFDPAGGYIVQYSPPDLKHEDDRVIVGKLFSKYKKAFGIKMKYTYLSDAIFMFQDVRIKDGELIVRLEQGSKIKTFKYDLE